MHPVIELYQGKRSVPLPNGTQLSLSDLWHLHPAIIGDGYFYIPWLFPITAPSSKWNRKIPLFSQEEAAYFARQSDIQTNFLKSFDAIMDYFGIVRNEQRLIVKDEIMQRHYWLRNIGHESKKISRIIRSMAICGQPELAKNLQQLALKLGKEKGYIQPETLPIWEHIFDEFIKVP
ncbi:opioid growth factor receptor-related protein [Pasteurellaceae bacterium LIM206]|nr:opioid growth factor receptor-related protein [Pasteurellaceae bacterium LIM206]